MSPQIRVNFPSINELLENPQLRNLVDRVSHHAVVKGARNFLDTLRQEVQQTAADIKVPTPTELAERFAKWILNAEGQELRPIINGTGILLNDELGGVPLAAEAQKAIMQVAGSYAGSSALAAASGAAHRDALVERLLRQLTGAEAALVVNSPASARFLAIASAASGKDVIVSRGEVVEGHDGVRLTDTVTSAGARLIEVGTANRTRVADYEAAISEQTAALLRIVPGSFAICGAAEAVSRDDLIEVGRQRGLTVIEELETGTLIDCSAFGLRGVPEISASVKAGADLVLCRGDRLVGGPACGLVVGKREAIFKIAQHPLFAAMSPNALVTAGLAATLQLYADPATAQQAIPLLSLLSTPVENLKNRAERLAPQLAASTKLRQVAALEGTTSLSGVAVPGQELPTWKISLTSAHGTALDLATQLAAGTPALRLKPAGDALLLDLRSVLPSQDMQIAEIFGRA